MRKRQLQFLLLFGGLTSLLLHAFEGQLRWVSFASGYFLYALNFIAISKIGSILVRRQSQPEAMKGSNLGIVLLLSGKIVLLAGSLYLALVYFDLHKLFFAGGAMVALLISSVSVYIGFLNGQAGEKSA